MHVTIDLGNAVNFSVSVDKESGYLYDAHQYSGEDVLVDLKSLLKQVSDVSLTDYVYFLTLTTLNSKSNNKTSSESDNKPNNNNSSTPENRQSVIVDPDVMIDCLRIYSVTGDNNYFKYLVTQLYKFWTLLSPVLYLPNDVDDNVKWDLYLHTPHLLLPKPYINNSKFFDVWLELNLNKEIVINGDQKFIYKSTKTAGKTGITTRYVGVNNKLTVSKINISNMQYTSCNNKNQGQFVVSKNGSPVAEMMYINGLRCGPSTAYIDNKVSTQFYYLDDLQQGNELTFYDSGRVLSEITYRNGEIVNKRLWYDDEHHSLEAVVEYSESHPFKGEHFYQDGTHAHITYVPMESCFERREHTIMLFTQSGLPLWKIVYGNPTIQYFFDDKNNVVSQHTYTPNDEYSLEARQWEIFVDDNDNDNHEGDQQ